MNTTHIFVGGHARNNNGDAGIGICFHSDPTMPPFYEDAEYIGVATQNSAVYKAILKALTRASEWHLRNVVIYTDNRLVTGQLGENMSARAQNIIPLFEDVKKLASPLDSCQVKLVPARDNKRSKELAKAASLATPEAITAQAIQFEVGPGITGLILAFTSKLMVVQFKYKKGSKIPAHQHFHEQASYLAKGTLKYLVANRDIIMRKGAALVIQGNSVHQLEALEDTTEIVIYYPMRSDLLGLN